MTQLQYSQPLEIKRGTLTTAGSFSGYAAVFGNRDSVDDVIERGAFSRTLGEWASKGALPAMLLQHGGMMGLGPAEDGIPIGRWLSMQEDAKGLHVEGQLFALDTQKGRYIHEGLKSGVLSGLSIGYVPVGIKYGEKAGDPNRTLYDVTLHEVSLCTFPANDQARVAEAKRASEPLTISTPREMEDFLHRAGLSRRDAKALMSGGWRALIRSNDSPDLAAAADELRTALAALRQR